MAGRAVRSVHVSILCVNAGSSSIKVAMYRPDAAEALVTGAVEGIGESESRLWLRDADGAVLRDQTQSSPSHDEAIDLVLGALDRIEGAPAVAAVGHRVVHGGRRFVAPVLIDGAVLQELRGLVHLAPLHMPPAIAAITAVAVRSPSIPQVACFDTAFHRRLPEIAQRLPLPEWAWQEGICRFGFHGLVYEHVTEILGPRCGRVVIAHLGSGASMAAVHDGLPIDTTMAFTPTAGIMMGTRTGDLDPGIIVHLLRDHGMDADQIEHLVNEQSGLQGVSGSTANMHSLLEARAHDVQADRAITMFCRSARKAIGALAATLGGIDQLVFTGGIGEHAPVVRAEICAGLEHLGIVIDPGRNGRNDAVVSAGAAPCSVRTVSASEDRVIARHTAALIG